MTANKITIVFLRAAVFLLHIDAFYATEPFLMFQVILQRDIVHVIVHAVIFLG